MHSDILKAHGPKENVVTVINNDLLGFSSFLDFEYIGF